MSEFHHLGKFLKQKRIESLYTQAKLANIVGVHTQFVSNWERGLCAPPIHCLQKLINVLDLNREILVNTMLEDTKNVIESKVYKKKKFKRS